MDVQIIFQDWLTSFLAYLPRLISAIVIFIITLIGSGVLANWVRKIFSKRITSIEILKVIYRITKWLVVIVGTIFALDQVSFDVTSFIAGLGIAGLTIGFALQDIAKNFISGILLLYRQPFKIGDFVKISDHAGSIKEINVRDTVLETIEGEVVIIPNQDVFQNAIINYSKSSLRRRKVMIGLGYEEDVEKAISIFLDAIKAVPGVASEPNPWIVAEEMGDSALILAALFWVDPQEHNFLAVQSNVIMAIKEASELHGINLPYPTQQIMLRHAGDFKST